MHHRQRRLRVYRLSKRAEFLKLKEWSPLQDYNLSVAATIQISLDNLGQQCQNMLRIFSHFNPTSIEHSSMHVLVQMYLRCYPMLVEGYRPGQLSVRLLGSAFLGSAKENMELVRKLVSHIRLVEMRDVADPLDHAMFAGLLTACSEHSRQFIGERAWLPGRALIRQIITLSIWQWTVYQGPC